MNDKILRGEIDALRYRLEAIEDTLDALTADMKYIMTKDKENRHVNGVKLPPPRRYSEMF